MKSLNKNKLILLLILTFVAFSFSVKQQKSGVLAATVTPPVAVPATTDSYWKKLDFAITFKQDLSATITETHDIMFRQRLDGQAFQSLDEVINISNYEKLTALKIYEKTKAGKLVQYTEEPTEQKVNGKFYIEKENNTQALFFVRIFFDAKNEEKTFIFDYTLTAPRYPVFMNFYTDYDELLLYPIPSNPNVFIQNLTMHLTLPPTVTEKDLYFWGLPQSTAYKTEIFANKISFSGILNKTDTNVGFDLLVKAGIFAKPADITRKTTTILPSKIAAYTPPVAGQTVNPRALTASAATVVGGLIVLLAGLYLFKVYLGIRLKKVSKKNKVFEDVDVLKYKNFKPYFSGLLLHKRVTRNDLTAMLVDLCIRGYLALRISRSKDGNGKIVNLFILDKSEVEVKNDVLSNPERIFLNNIFKRNNSVYLTSLEDSYRFHTAYFYSSMSKEILSYKLFAVPPFIHNLSLYKFLLKVLFILLSLSFLLLPSNYIILFLVPVFFVFFTNVLIIERPAGTKVKRNLIAFQAFCLNWKEKTDATFVARIPYFIALACFNDVSTVVSKEKTLQELEVAWLTLDIAEVAPEEEKTIAIEKDIAEGNMEKDSFPTWNDLALFLDKIRKTFRK